jgi:hypothetical protein
VPFDGIIRMSRIPVFIERSARKGWNTSVESCIFIACDSVETSSEIDDILEPDPTLTDGNEETVNDLENVGDDLEFSEDRLIDKVQFNDTLDSKLDEEDDKVKGVVQGNGRMAVNSAVTFTIVSCCKGVVNTTCNCNKCNEGVSLEEFVTSRPGDGKKMKEVDTSNKGPRSLIPRPRKLTAGKVAITPAPVKKSKTKPEKREKAWKNEQKISTKQIKAVGKNESKSNLLEMEIVKRKKNESDNSFNESSMIINTDKEKDKFDVFSDVKKQLVYIDIDDKSGCIDEKERTCTESGMFRSQQDPEDSEPEYAQHENLMQKNEDELLQLQESSKQIESKTVGVNTKHGTNQAVTSFIHCDSSDGIGKCCNDDKGAIKQVKAVTPRGSGIPRFQNHGSKDSYKDRSKLNTADSPRSHCVSVSPNYSVTPRSFSRASSRDSNSSRNSSISPHRTYTSSVSSLYKSSRPSPRSRQPVKPNHASVQDEQLQNEEVKTSNAKKTVILKTQIVHETKSSRLRRKAVDGGGLSDDEISHEIRKENARGKVHVSAAVPTFTDDVKDSMYHSRRNLPRAPAQVRKVRYGQRCIVDEEDSFEGEQCTLNVQSLADL